MFVEGPSFGALLGSLSDLLGLRLSLPLQSRPAQISDGTQQSTEPLKFCQGSIANVSLRPTSNLLTDAPSRPQGNRGH